MDARRPPTSAGAVARGYAAIVVGLRHIIPLAWIAVAVAATWRSLGWATPPRLRSTTSPPRAAAPRMLRRWPRAPSASRWRPTPPSSSAIPAAVRGCPAPPARRRARRPRPPRPGAQAAAGGHPTQQRERPHPVGRARHHGHHLPALRPDASLDDEGAAAQHYAQRTLGGPRAAVVGVTGAAPAREAQFHEIEQALPLIEAASVVLIAVIVALAFRSIGAPLVALATAGIAYTIAMRVLPWLGERANVTVPKEIEPVVVVLLLGLVTDYSIFFLSATRRRLRAGDERLPAARAAVAEVAPIVVTAGLIVAAGTAALVVGHLQFFRAFGPGLAATTLITLAVSVTLVPALVALFGPRLSARGSCASSPRRRRRATRARGLGPRQAPAAPHPTPHRRAAHGRARARAPDPALAPRAVAHGLLAPGRAPDRRHRHRAAGLRRPECPLDRPGAQPRARAPGGRPGAPRGRRGQPRLRARDRLAHGGRRPRARGRGAHGAARAPADARRSPSRRRRGGRRARAAAPARAAGDGLARRRRRAAGGRLRQRPLGAPAIDHLRGCATACPSCCAAPG